MLVDDASSDGSADLVETLSRSAPLPVRTIRFKENSGGPAHPINVGIEASDGDLISVLDQDDVYSPEFIARHHRVLCENSEIRLAFSWCGFFPATSDSTLQPPQLKQRLAALGTLRDDWYNIPGRDLLLELFEAGGALFGGYPSFMFRKSDWKKLSGVNQSLRICSDVDFFARTCLLGNVALVPRIGYRRRLHAENICNRVDEMMREQTLTLIRIANQINQTDFPECDEAVFRRLFRDAYWSARRGQIRQSLWYHWLAARNCKLRQPLFQSFMKLPAHAVLSLFREPCDPSTTEKV